MSAGGTQHPLHRSNKVGLVAYGWQHGKLVFLIHLPKAKNLNEQAEMQWGLVRGTVRSHAGEDLRSLEALRATPPEHIEPPEASLLHEAEEEAGIRANDFLPNTLKSLGFLSYNSQEKVTYDIHFFTAQVDPAQLDTFKKRAEDAMNLAFKPLSEIKKMANDSQFKRGYVEILENVERSIARAPAPQSR